MLLKSLKRKRTVRKDAQTLQNEIIMIIHHVINKLILDDYLDACLKNIKPENMQLYVQSIDYQSRIYNLKLLNHNEIILLIIDQENLKKIFLGEKNYHINIKRSELLD